MTAAVFHFSVRGTSKQAEAYGHLTPAFGHPSPQGRGAHAERGSQSSRAVCVRVQDVWT
jgi:hypothetical protein